MDMYGTISIDEMQDEAIKRSVSGSLKIVLEKATRTLSQMTSNIQNPY